ncbi:chromosome partitioning protein, ParB family [Pilibacter termitis]|uniref:Chromosome partitioning protein, ParB family n=1 Tax=Pilibacter termitis TaxID=263852 RepID=A0A1T4RE97_9ENTE|nr:ParB/RepB/Spo0J family partition protein [Pilibacter termitis]SKA14229.1 chromosome partitioning protein, ParB family [Pilibacter termitis]
MAKKKAMGRGLEALFEDAPSLEELEVIETNEQIIDIPLVDLRPNPYNPRKTFDEESLQELANSIQQDGVFQPIIVRKSTVKGYELIAGERRFRASKIAGLEKIPAIVREFTEDAMMQIAILENLQREDLNPLEEAEAYETLMVRLNLTQNQVATRLGKSRSVIANKLRLLSLPTEVKNWVTEGKMTDTQARTLLGLKDRKKIIPLAEKVIAEGITVRVLEQMVAQINEGGAKKKTKPSKMPKPLYIRESEEMLTDKFGTNVNIADKGNKGKIEIEYVSESDLTRILDILEIRLDK